jgi:ferritin-like metal-binding protein YciE
MAGTQIERINECFELLGKTARAKPCKGMMGPFEESQEILAEAKKRRHASPGTQKAMHLFRTDRCSAASAVCG